MSPDDGYEQRLPALELSIERNTENVPTDGRWYLRQKGAVLGRFRSLRAAQAAWRKTVAESGWKPEAQSIDPKEAIKREKLATDRDARNEYWHSGRRHSW